MWVDLCQWCDNDDGRGSEVSKKTRRTDNSLGGVLAVYPRVFETGAADYQPH